jgi:hypothetical protein
MAFTRLGLLGPAGSGKDLVGDWFVQKGFIKVAFADPMKRFAQKAFGFTIEQLWGSSEQRNHVQAVDVDWWLRGMGRLGMAFEEIEPVLKPGQRVLSYLSLVNWYSQLGVEHKNEISARIVLQTIGTEWGRNIDPLMWAKYAHKVAATLSKGAHSYTQVEGLKELRSSPHISRGVVIPDHRFINELETTQRVGGYVIRLRRLAQEERTVGLIGHQSETEQKTIQDDAFDLVLELQEGVEKVHAVLEAILEEAAWATKSQTGWQVHYRS